MQKKTILLIIMVSAALFMASCANSGAAGSGDTKSEADVKSDETSITASTASTAAPVAAEAKLNVTVPDGWSKVDGSVLEHQYMKNTASFMIKKENFNKEKLDDVVTEAKSIFQKSFDNFQEIKTENTTVAGKEAKKLEFTCKVSTFTMKYLYVYFFIGKDTYAITFGDQQSTFDGLSSDYETILNSITIG